MNENFLRQLKFNQDGSDSYPFSIPALQNHESIEFTKPVTFLVGENGSGKSTLIEAIAIAAGFNSEGGTKNYSFTTSDTSSELHEHVTLVRGIRKEKYGYFLRAESFYATATYTDSIGVDFGGKSLHEQSHGEAFLSIIKEFRPGLFIFDEPEAAFSPQRIMTLLIEINRLVQDGSQFIIATHSPMLLAFPGATIYQLSDTGVTEMSYEDVEHVNITRDFLNAPQAYLKRLFSES